MIKNSPIALGVRTTKIPFDIQESKRGSRDLAKYFVRFNIDHSGRRLYLMVNVKLGESEIKGN